MNAIEIQGLRKCFGKRTALAGLNMTVPAGAIYALIGENGSGKSTTEKLVCGLLRPDGGEIRLFGRPHDDPAARAGLGVLIEAPGCYANYSVWNNLALQAANLGLRRPGRQVAEVLRAVRMEGAASGKYKTCSLGMKQRVGIAMALLGEPTLLILDEPINGLDADGMRIMREILTDLVRTRGCTVLISSHILGELEKIATHYGIMRRGRMLREMTAAELEASCRRCTELTCGQTERALSLLARRCADVREEEGCIRVYDTLPPEALSAYLYENGVTVRSLRQARITLEHYYADLMREGEGA